MATAALLLVGAAVARHGRAGRATYGVVARGALMRLARGESVRVPVRFERRHGFRGPLTVGIRHLPARSRGRWVLPDGRPLTLKRATRRSVVLPASADSAVFVLRTTGRTHLGRARPRLTVTARHQRRFRFLRMLVVRARGTRADSGDGLRLSASTRAPLYPGASVPLVVRITNLHDKPVRLTQIHAGVDNTTTRPACSGRGNYEVRQYTGPYPLLIPPGTTTLDALTPDASAMPQVRMRDLPTNQDDCRGAVFTLTLSAEATQ